MKRSLAFSVSLLLLTSCATVRPAPPCPAPLHEVAQTALGGGAALGFLGAVAGAAASGTWIGFSAGNVIGAAAGLGLGVLIGIGGGIKRAWDNGHTPGCQGPSEQGSEAPSASERMPAKEVEP